MNFSFDRFLKPLTSSDKNIKIYDNNNVVKYVINPFNVKTLNISNNLITIKLESDRTITLDFANQNETKQAIQKLQLYVDTLKNSLVPYYIQHAVEIEAPNFTKGPTGSIGNTGSQGLQGPDGQKGETGKSAYDIWSSSHFGTEQDFFNSLIGPIGPTGPRSFINTDELDFTGQSINATVENKNIEIVTKGSGNLLFKIDRDGWLLKYGLLFNNIENIWGAGSTIDDEGNIYTTGGDFTSIGAWVTKTGENGNMIWQKQVDFYSYGDCIVYQNGHIYILVTNLSDINAIVSNVIKIDKNGNLIKTWSFDWHLDLNTNLPDAFYCYEITVDEDENIYYVGSQYNSPNVQDISGGITNLVMGKLNTTTNKIDWNYIVDGGLHLQDRGYSIKYKAGFVYTIGTIINDPGSGTRADIFLSKYNKNGDKIWAKVIGNTETYQDGLSVTIDSDYSIYIVGYLNFDPVPYNAPVGPFNNFYMKLDLNGNMVWTKSIDGFNRSIVSVEVNDSDSLFLVSTQASSSTPSRVSTDLYVAKISKLDGSIIWQQYVGSPYRDSIWANIPGISANGHRTLTVDKKGKSLYITGLTKEGNNQYHNSFLMSYDQKSLPEGDYGNWNIQNATFVAVDSNFEYINDTFNNPNITIGDILKDSTPLQSVSVSNGNNFIIINKEKEVTLFSPNTELYVKGIVTIDDLYTLPRKAGSKGKILTYGDSGSLLEWKLPTVTLGFNDYEEIANNILGATAMDGIFVDPTLGAISGQFDDEFFEVALPFDVNFMGITYSKVYVGSNSFITFGSGYSNSGGYTANNPPLPGIFIGATDRSCQALYTKTTSDKFIIRYEGSLAPQGPASAPHIEIEWEVTFNKDSSILDISIGNNDSYFTADGLSVIKNNNEIYKELNLSPGKAFRIIKGYGYRPVQANRLNYINIDGLSYSVTEDPHNLGDDIVNIDFSGLGGAGKFYYQGNVPSVEALSGIQPGTLWYDSDQGYLYVYVNDGDTAQWVTQVNSIGPVGPKGNDGNFTTLSSTGSNIFLDSDSDFHILSGIQNGSDQSVYTIESFSSDQGMYLQVNLPIMLNDQDHIFIGLKDNLNNWAYYVELTHNTPSVGNMIIYDSIGGVITYSQTYNQGDIFSIYVDGEKVYYKINGLTLWSCDFITNSSLKYKFFCETNIGTLPNNTLSSDYSFEEFKFYPTGSVSIRKNLLPTSTKNSDYIVSLEDYVIRVDATNNDVTISLPSVSSSYGNGRGYEFVIKRVDNSLNVVYLNGHLGELIDTFATNALVLNSMETKRVQSNGTNWDIL